MTCQGISKAYLVGAFSAIGGFLFGYHTGVISGVLIMDDFKRKMHIQTNYSNGINNTDNSDVRNGTIVGVLLIGCFLGSLIGGQTSDRFSRKYSISIFSLIFTFSAAIETASYEIIQLLIDRFFAGIAIGALSMIVPVYHSEITSTQNRGRIIILQQWAITIGIATSFWVNFTTHSIENIKTFEAEWRIPLGLQVVPSLILAIGILFCPFSPRWLVSHDRLEEAKTILLKIRSTSDDEIEEEMTRITVEVAYLREYEIDSYRQLFHAPLRHPFLLGIGIQIFQQLTGINAILYYTPNIFQELLPNIGNVSQVIIETSPLFATGINGCINVLATIPTIIFIDRLSRRILLITGALVMSISLLIISIRGFNDEENQWISLIFMYLFVGGFAYSWGPIAWVYCAEIFPLTMRAKATSLTTSANWATNTIISFLALTLFRGSLSNTFFLFSILCAFMMSTVYFFCPETKHKHLEITDMNDNKQNYISKNLKLKRKTCKTISEQRVRYQVNSSVSLGT